MQKKVKPVIKVKKTVKSTYKRKKPRAVGRPSKIKSPVCLRRWVEAYFKKCDEHKLVKVSKKGNRYEYDDPIPYSIEGIAGALDISRECLRELEMNPKFVAVISWARERVSQNRIEKGLSGKQNPLLVKFLLSKNDKEHYDETQKVELSGNVGIRGLLEELSGSANKLPGSTTASDIPLRGA